MLTFKWRMNEMCDNCPFDTSGNGHHLSHSLGAARMREIRQSLLNGALFPCHKTSLETGNGTDLHCAGAFAFQTAHGIETDYMRMCQSMEKVVQETKETIFTRMGIPKRRKQR